MNNRPNLPTVLGLLFGGGDPAAALIRDGRIIASAEEERFNRVKHARGAFPLQAVKYCLQEAGIDITDVDCIAVGRDAFKFPVRMAKFYLSIWADHQPCARHVLKWHEKNVDRYTPQNHIDPIVEHLLKSVPPAERPEILFVEHHFAHATSTAMVSGFEEAAIVTADGHGEDDCSALWVYEGGKIRHLQRWYLPQSLGWFYTKFTEWFGFQSHDGEGKLMGLAAYGKDVPELREKVAQVVRLTGGDDAYHVNPRFFLDEYVRDIYTAEWLRLFGEPRERESKEPFSTYHKDLAYAVQDALERAGLALVQRALKLTGKKKVCVSGGIFMNCKMNGVLAQHVGLENFFVQPAAGDNGIPLGAALAIYHDRNLPWTERMEHLYYGPAYTNEEIQTALEAAGLTYTRPENMEQETAKHLAASRVVGWFQGRMELGARALGNRSILANPLDPRIKDLVNNKVKFREAWRPFCPSVLEKDGEQYFDFHGDLPFMIVACEARDGMMARLPSVVHVDNTVRVQTVNPERNRRYWDLLREFRQITGYGVMLNTSFNIKGEPIVCRPQEAIQCFLKTAIDVLAIGDFIVTDKTPKPQAAANALAAHT
jgi:carbamoyltransferase